MDGLKHWDEDKSGPNIENVWCKSNKKWKKSDRIMVSCSVWKIEFGYTELFDWCVSILEKSNYTYVTFWKFHDQTDALIT